MVGVVLYSPIRLLVLLAHERPPRVEVHTGQPGLEGCALKEIYDVKLVSGAKLKKGLNDVLLKRFIREMSKWG